MQKNKIFSHFDMQTVNFLRQIQPLLADLHLQFHCFASNHLENLRIILVYLVPLLDGSIHSLHCEVLPMVKRYFPGDKLAKLKMLSFHQSDDYQQEDVDFCINWLTSSGRESCAPVLCEMQLVEGQNIFAQQLCTAINQVGFFCFWQENIIRKILAGFEFFNKITEKWLNLKCNKNFWKY